MPTDEIVTEVAAKAFEIRFGTKGVIAISTIAAYGAVSAGHDVYRGIKKIRERKQHRDNLKAVPEPPQQ